MVICGLLPAGGGMAGCSISGKTALVCVFRLMTGITVRGCAHKNVIDMAAFAGHADVFAVQFEGG